VIWVVIALLARYSSLSGLVASAATPAVLWFGGHVPAALLFVLLTILLWIRHRENIVRLVNGTEGKIGRKADAAQPTQ
jgi:glycerol-3-phosphate acyltransferase PlsY